MKLTLAVVAGLLVTGCSTTPASTENGSSPATATTLSMTSKSAEAVAHVQKGEMLLDNVRQQEAAAEFAEALKIDPEFVLARAYHGQAVPGADGLKEMESAAAAAAALPEPERVLIQGMTAGRRGDFPAAKTAYTRLTEVMPSEWRGHYLLGQQLLLEQKYADAMQALKKATALNAGAGGAQNMLGYAAFRQGDVDGAIAAFTEYARILPQEPNPQDSLGEALMGAGRFKEAEAAFQKALTLSPQFWNAHQGTAYAKYYAGDWKGGHDAMAKAKAGAPSAAEKIGVDTEQALLVAAQGNIAEALRLLNAAEKTTGAGPSDVAFLPINRAVILLTAGRAREALAPLASALKTAESGQLTPGQSRNLRREALRVRISAEAALRDADAAQQTSAALDEGAAARSDDAAAQSSMHFGRAQLALARGDVAAARPHFEQCSGEDTPCKWQGVLAADKAGDKTGAAAAREQLLKLYQRDPIHLLIRSQLKTPVTT
jgi:tetratricopeptide (TPR) repeat protein